MDVGDALGRFEATPWPRHRWPRLTESLKDGTPVVVKVVHSGAQAKVLDDLELMRALAGFVEDRDEALAAYSPTVVVDEFDTRVREAQRQENWVDFCTKLPRSRLKRVPRQPEPSPKQPLRSRLPFWAREFAHTTAAHDG